MHSSFVATARCTQHSDSNLRRKIAKAENCAFEMFFVFSFYSFSPFCPLFRCAAFESNSIGQQQQHHAVAKQITFLNYKLIRSKRFIDVGKRFAFQLITKIYLHESTLPLVSPCVINLN